MKEKVIKKKVLFKQENMAKKAIKMNTVTKRVLLFITMIAMFAMFIPVAVFADEGRSGSDSYSEAEVIQVGDIKRVDLQDAKSSKYFKFTPEIDATCVFESQEVDEYADTWCQILVWDKDAKKYETILEDDDSAGLWMFRAVFKAQAGKEYILVARTYDSGKSFNVKLTTSNITGIALTPTVPIVIDEKTDGYMSVDGDERVFVEYNLPKFKEGDKLTVTMGDENVDYIYNSRAQRFVNGEEKISEWEIIKQTDQYNNPWSSSRTCYYSIKYMGCTSVVPVTIMESDIATIRFTPTKPYEYTQSIWHGESVSEKTTGKHYFRYYTPELKTGDTLVKVMRDGTEKEYIYNEDTDSFFAGDGEELYSTNVYIITNQKNIHWVPGKNNFLTVAAFGRSTNVVVKIVGKNTMTVKTKTITAKKSTLKKKTLTYKNTKGFTVKKPVGKVTYKITKKPAKAKNKIVISSKGKITLKKGLKKGKYKVTVKVSAAGNRYYMSKSKTVTLTVRVS